MNVLVLGGTGFIGRHAVAALQARGDTVTVGTRHPGRARRRFPQLALQATRLERLREPGDWRPRLAGESGPEPTLASAGSSTSSAASSVPSTSHAVRLDSGVKKLTSGWGHASAYSNVCGRLSRVRI